MTIIYHNPRCSKSRQALALIRERGIEPSIELYLETPPSAAALAATCSHKDADCGEAGLPVCQVAGVPPPFALPSLCQWLCGRAVTVQAVQRV